MKKYWQINGKPINCYFIIVLCGVLFHDQICKKNTSINYIKCIKFPANKTVEISSIESKFCLILFISVQLKKKPEKK